MLTVSIFFLCVLSVAISDGAWTTRNKREPIILKEETTLQSAELEDVVNSLISALETKIATARAATYDVIAIPTSHVSDEDVEDDEDGSWIDSSTSENSVEEDESTIPKLSKSHTTTTQAPDLVNSPSVGNDNLGKREVKGAKKVAKTASTTKAPATTTTEIPSTTSEPSTEQPKKLTRKRPSYPYGRTAAARSKDLTTASPTTTTTTTTEAPSTTPVATATSTASESPTDPATGEKKKTCTRCQKASTRSGKAKMYRIPLSTGPQRMNIPFSLF